MWRGQDYPPAEKLNFAGIGPKDTSQDFGQRGLTSAVSANQAMTFSGAGGEVHSAESLHAAEALPQAAYGKGYLGLRSAKGGRLSHGVVARRIVNPSHGCCQPNENSTGTS
jgi:hypothetical protein